MAAQYDAAMQEDVPVGHRGGPPLYGRMMKAIRSGHDWGNKIRMLKLPLIFTEDTLYAGAIAQFFWLSEELEAQLDKNAGHPMIAKVRELGLRVTPGYMADLKQLYGEDWREAAKAHRTAATDKYIEDLRAANPVSLVAAAFILYGALVVGGGKQTQAKVRKIIPSCEHQLFDVAEDMKVARAAFKSTFTGIGKEWPEHFETLEKEAARYMALNNTVVVSVRCVGWRVTRVAIGVALTGVAVVAAIRMARSG